MDNNLTQAELDTNVETGKHIEQVRHAMSILIADLITRAQVHDASKLERPEVAVFTEFTPKLATTTYGSQEYKEFLAAMKPALDHHYAHNSHHPEHYRAKLCSCIQTANAELVRDGWPRVYGHPDAEGGYEGSRQQLEGKEYVADPRCPICRSVGWIKQGINGMNLLDIVEMFCDWYAACKRHNDGDIRKSIDINTKRFDISPQLATIFHNTVPILEAEEK